MSTPFLGLLLFVFVATFPPLDDEAVVSLPVHMAQHFAIVVAGLLIAYPVFRARRFTKFSTPVPGALGFLAASALTLYWHPPAYWDATILNPLIHALEHLTFLLVGLLAGATLPAFRGPMGWSGLALGYAGETFYALYLLLVAGPVYPLYSVVQQRYLGLFAFLLGNAMLILCISFLGRWFQGVVVGGEPMSVGPGSPAVVPPIRGRAVNAHSRLRSASRASSLTMISILAIYFAVVLPTSGLAPATQPSTHQSVVYIKESLVEWEYTPYNITVVIGANNTVV